MSKEADLGTRKMLLDSQLSRELDILIDRKQIDGLDSEIAVGTLWESENPGPRLEDLVNLFNNKELEKDEELLVLTGIAWELIWGKAPPRIIEQAKQQIGHKITLKGHLGKLYRLWGMVQTVDTDDF